jgi:hypothetical protein
VYRNGKESVLLILLFEKLWTGLFYFKPSSGPGSRGLEVPSPICRLYYRNNANIILNYVLIQKCMLTLIIIIIIIIIRGATALTNLGRLISRR